jgi:hypothetical protein
MVPPVSSLIAVQRVDCVPSRRGGPVATPRWLIDPEPFHDSTARDTISAAWQRLITGEFMPHPSRDLVQLLAKDTTAERLP